jgi:hypothetical protein
MKRTTIVWIEQRKLKPELLTQLRTVLPEGDQPASRRFYCQLEEDDPRMDQILTILQQFGFQRSRDLFITDKDDFYFARGRHYDADDFASFSLLQPMGNPDLEDYIWPDEDGTLLIKKRFFKRKRLLDTGNIHSLLVSADIRTLLEEAGFRGMKFKPVAPQEQGAVVALENLWELTTDRRMPPLSDYCTFFDQQAKPVRGSAETANQYLEDFYPQSELHYRASTVRDWPWDFTLTHELFWYGEKRHRRRLVVSKRFYDFCRDNKLKMDWLPVQIDPD